MSGPRWLAPSRLVPLLALAGLTWVAPAAAADDEEAADADSSEAKSGDGEKSKSDEPKADAKDSKSDENEPAAASQDMGHMGQLGLRVGLVAGFRMVLRYSDSPYCTEPNLQKPLDKQQKFCGHTAPLAADFGLSFALLDFIEPFAWARLGLSAEQETDTKPLVVIGVGARIYTMSDAAFKILIEPAMGWELEGGRKNAPWTLGNPQYDKDFMFHVAVGPQYDFSRNFGAYLTGGVSADVVRALGSSLDLNIGVQGRYP